MDDLKGYEPDEEKLPGGLPPAEAKPKRKAAAKKAPAAKKAK